MKMLIIRSGANQHQTIGTGLIFDNLGRMLFEFQTLELPFLDNKVGISCIPFGNYKVEKRQNDRFGSHFHVKDVEGRSMILIHLGNYHRNTSGCILVGSEHKYLDTDNCLDVVDSRITMKKLVEIMPSNFDLTITDFISKL